MKVIKADNPAAVTGHDNWLVLTRTSTGLYRVIEGHITLGGAKLAMRNLSRHARRNKHNTVYTMVRREATQEVTA